MSLIPSLNVIWYRGTLYTMLINIATVNNLKHGAFFNRKSAMF